MILLIGVLLAVVAFVGIIVVFNTKSPDAGTPARKMSDVVIATRDIPLGEVVVKDAVGTKQVPDDEVTPDEFTDPGKVIGQVARQNITNGATVLQSMFTGTGAPVIGSSLPTGMRAMPVRVDAITGVGSLILPGDRVDVVVTLDIKMVLFNPGDPGASIPPTLDQNAALQGNSSKVILQNVEVRAVLGAGGGIATTGAGAVDLATNQQVVILGLTPQQAEVLEFVGQGALTKGGQGAISNITLVLRSPLDKSAPDVKTTGIVLKNLITDYGVLPPALLEASLPPTK
jgi:Flp pilus assembly protein CpaB